MLLLPLMVGMPIYMPSQPRYDAYNRATIEVIIDQHYQGKVYTCGSTIAGYVTIRVISRDLPFDSLEIYFSGLAVTRLELLRQSPFCVKPFMKLQMPIRDADLPPDRVFHAPGMYAVPFHFVVPHHLTIGACNHCCSCQVVRDQHLRLPPSLGSWDSDGLAPDATHIEYSIKAKISRSVPGVTRPIKLAEGHSSVKVLPSLPEDAPLHVTIADKRYKLRKAKRIRKGLFSTKLGQVTAASSQPGAIMLSADGHRASSSSVNVSLEYVPSNMDTPPPKVYSVNCKLISTTFSSAAPMNHFPNLGSKVHRDTNSCVSYTTSTSIFSRPLDVQPWERHDVPTLRRNSALSSTIGDEEVLETGGSSKGDKMKNHNKKKKKKNGSRARSWCCFGGGEEKEEAVSTSTSTNNAPEWSPIKYTTGVEIPFTIPARHRDAFVPSFHSCLISRTYTLQLSLSVGPAFSTVRLLIPFQVGVEAVFSADEGVEVDDDELPSFEAVMAQSAGGRGGAAAAGGGPGGGRGGGGGGGGGGISLDVGPGAGPGSSSTPGTYSYSAETVSSPQSVPASPGADGRLNSLPPQYDYTSTHYGSGLAYF